MKNYIDLNTSIICFFILIIGFVLGTYFADNNTDNTIIENKVCIWKNKSMTIQGCSLIDEYFNFESKINDIQNKEDYLFYVTRGICDKFCDDLESRYNNGSIYFSEELCLLSCQDIFK